MQSCEAFDATAPSVLNTSANYGANQKALQAAMNAYASYATLRSGVPEGELAHTSHSATEGCHSDFLPEKMVQVVTSDPLGQTETWTLWKPTACLHAILDHHEAVHREQCESLNGLDGLGRWVLLKDKIQEEIDAYSAEHTYLLQQRERLLCSCSYYQMSLLESRTLPKPDGLAGKPIILGLKTTTPGAIQGEQEGLHASLRPNAQGEFMGEGEGVIGADIAFTGLFVTISGNGHQPFTFHISADEPFGTAAVHTILELGAKDGTGTDMVAKNPLATVTVHTDLEGRDATAVVTRKTNLCFVAPPTCGTVLPQAEMLPKNFAFFWPKI